MNDVTSVAEKHEELIPQSSEFQIDFEENP